MYSKHIAITFLLLLTYGASFSQPTPKSNMAVLMNKMLKYLQTERKQVLKHKPTKPIPFSITLLYNSQLTPGKRLATNHKEMTDNFLALLEAYKSTQNENDRVKNYNLLVNSCIACHQKVCPGPIEVIEQNFFE